MPLKNAKAGCLLAVSFEAVPKFRTSKRKRFFAVFCTFFGNLGSVDVLRKLYEVLCEFSPNKLRKYGGANSFKLLKPLLKTKLISPTKLYSSSPAALASDNPACAGT